MVARKPSRPKTSRDGRLRAVGGPRNNSIGRSPPAQRNDLRTRAAPPRRLVWRLRPGLPKPRLRCCGRGGLRAYHRKFQAEETNPPGHRRPRRCHRPAARTARLGSHACGDALSGGRGRKAAAQGGPAAALDVPEAAPATGPSPSRANKGAEPHAAPRTAAPAPTTRTTPAAAPAEISLDLGLGLAQALSAELAGLSQRLLEASTASAQQLASARSVPDLIEIQARQLKALSETWLQHTSRMSEIYLAAIRPGERR